MPDATIISPMPFRYAGREPHLVQNFQTALLEAAKRAASVLNPIILQKGDEVLRAVGQNEDREKGPKLSIEGGRQLHRDSSKIPNRWSGTMPLSGGGNVQHGALYVSQDLNSFLNESMRFPERRKLNQFLGKAAAPITSLSALRDGSTPNC